MRATKQTQIKAFLLFLFLALVALPLWSQESGQETQAAETTETAPQTEPAAEAAETTGDEDIQTEIDGTVSVWGTDVVEDSSKAEEYGEVPQGFLIESLKVAVNMKDDRFLGIRAKNVGLNDGRYGFDYGVSGSYELSIDYAKIPHLFSKDGETIWNESASGIWTLPDALQGAIQGLNDVPTSDPTYQSGLAQQRAFISNLLLDAHPQQLGLQRNRGTVGFNFSPNTHWNYGVEYFRENRDGFRPYGTTFGFSWITELPEHIDYNTDRVRTGVEYASNGRTFAAAYEFSGFNNEIQSMIWDNPYRLTDRAEQTVGDGTSRARVQLPADNHSNMISLSAATPVGRGKITGAFAYNTWKDELQLLPFTINSALPQVPLPSSTFNGELRNITANVRYYTPVGSKANFTANYRLYDQSNRNDELLFAAFAPTDSGVTLEDEENPLFAYKTNSLDFDFHGPLFRSLRWYAGYGFNRWDREERDTTQTDTNTFRAGLDANASDRITLHAKYQYDRRRSDEFDLDHPVYDVIPLRRFDTADLNRNVFRVTADITLNDASSLGLNASLQNNDYTNTLYGLLEAKYYTVGADFSYAVTARSTFSAWYEHAQNTTDQQGRQSGSTVSTSTTFDWTANIEDKYDTLGVGYLMNFRDGKWAWNADFIYATADGFLDLFGGTSIRPIGALDIPNADDTDHYVAKTGLTVKAFPHAKFAINYWFDKYTIDDFAENAIQTDLITVTVQTPTGPVTSSPGVILLNARQGDYTYHTGWIAFIYSW